MSKNCFSRPFSCRDIGLHRTFLFCLSLPNQSKWIWKLRVFISKLTQDSVPLFLPNLTSTHFIFSSGSVMLKKQQQQQIQSNHHLSAAAAGGGVKPAVSKSTTTGGVSQAAFTHSQVLMITDYPFNPTILNCLLLTYPRVVCRTDFEAYISLGQCLDTKCLVTKK